MRFAMMASLAGLLAYGSAYAQDHKMSDQDMIKLALSAAPKTIAKDATVAAMDHDGTMRVPRQGSGQWTCMPGHMDPKNPDPMCGDKNAMEWAGAWMAKQQPPLHSPSVTRCT